MPIKTPKIIQNIEFICIILPAIIRSQNSYFTFGVLLAHSAKLLKHPCTNVPAPAASVWGWHLLLAQYIVISNGFCSGQAANSHVGATRPTAEPSGQILASIVQPMVTGLLESLTHTQTLSTTKTTAMMAAIINNFETIDFIFFAY
jgi:hypothetical protein